MRRHARSPKVVLSKLSANNGPTEKIKIYVFNSNSYVNFLLIGNT